MRHTESSHSSSHHERLIRTYFKTQTRSGTAAVPCVSCHPPSPHAPTPSLSSLPVPFPQLPLPQTPILITLVTGSRINLRYFCSGLTAALIPETWIASKSCRARRRWTPLRITPKRLRGHATRWEATAVREGVKRRRAKDEGLEASSPSHLPPSISPSPLRSAWATQPSPLD